MSFWVGFFLVVFFGLAFMSWCLVRAADDSYEDDYDYDLNKYVRELDKYNMRSRVNNFPCRGSFSLL